MSSRALKSTAPVPKPGPRVADFCLSSGPDSSGFAFFLSLFAWPTSTCCLALACLVIGISAGCQRSESSRSLAEAQLEARKEGGRGRQDMTEAERREHCQKLVEQALREEPFTEGGPHTEGEVELLRGVMECRALASGRRENCEQVRPKVIGHNCRARFGFWTTAAKADDDANWRQILATHLMTECRPTIPEKTCEALYEAVLHQKPERCPKDLEDFCGGIASGELKDCLGNKDCEELAFRLGLLDEGGVQAVVEMGWRKDPESAAAVLGLENPCENSAKLFMEKCRSLH